MSLQQLINESLKKEQQERLNKERSGKFSPSLLGRCFRCQILNRAGITPSNPPDERALRIFRCGKLFHDFVQNFLPNHQIEILCENDDFKGYADIVTEDTVYDIKSVHSGSFWYCKKEDYDVKKEKYHNWLQLTYYAWILKKPKIVLVQISKDDLCINEYVDFTDKWLENLQHEVDLLREEWKNYPKLPKAEPRFNKEGKYCSYRDKCKEIEIGDKRDTTEYPCFIEPKSRRGGKSTPEVAKA